MIEEHTPELWEADGVLVRTAGGALVADCWGNGTGGENERKARACLIATAPEMLAVLQDLLRMNTTASSEWGSLRVGTVQRARSIVAKAEGRSLQTSAVF